MNKDTLARALKLHADMSVIDRSLGVLRSMREKEMFDKYVYENLLVREDDRIKSRIKGLNECIEAVLIEQFNWANKQLEEL